MYGKAGIQIVQLDCVHLSRMKKFKVTHDLVHEEFDMLVAQNLTRPYYS